MITTDAITRRLKRLNVKLSPDRLYYAPDWLVLGVNNLCNLHCRMCDVGTGHEESNFYQHLTGATPRDMPLPLIQAILDQAAASFPRTKIGYAFTEPSIYPHLVESLAYAEERGLYTTVTTNGLNLEKLAKTLVDAGLDEIFVSLDGPPAIHNHIRGHPRSFERAFAGIEALREADTRGRLKISVYCTITEWSVGHLVEFAELFRSTPVAHVGFMHTNFTPAPLAEAHNRLYGERYAATASNMAGISLDAIDLDTLMGEVNTLRVRAWPFGISFSPELQDAAALTTFYRHPEVKIGRVCNDAFRNVMIKSNGDVIPAHGRCYDVVAGNLYQSSLEEIWNAPALATFRKVLMEAGGLLPACARCCSAF